MAGLSLTSLRAGHKYWIQNFGEKLEFEILEILYPQDFVVKDLHTLEIFRLSDITRFGKGKDYEIRDL